MKHSGFTLAEILVTLTIIGVVATITIPALNARVKDQANASKLGSSINILENAFGMMITREDVEDISKTAFASNTSQINNYVLLDSINNGTYHMKNGATFTLSKISDGGVLDIDVNGNKPPNTNGKDQFKYTLNGESGTLTPTGAAEELAKNNYKITIKE